MKLISQLINGISRFLQKLLRYSNDTILSTPFVSSFPLLPVIICLNLNKKLLLLLSAVKLAVALLSSKGCSSL